ncbi:YOR305W-like protein [Saccharomyces cerevisiae x Saccharomyces kudriavzevii VIN7]|uniref:Required for respiratory growth protein 7, mitochondrial n=1 Tax=Saccharomyces cerevisiae x Saccharomyces kudriavzevii (strain VIN7) TaxID=1095631 RepID=H0H1I6_SACCK|nr:YOR305W-like protein [Saccharomyces cerevisiae x Saccharomyces kudriavzevii VIN7]
MPNMIRNYLGRRCLNNSAIQAYIKQNAAVAHSTVFQGNLYEYTVMRELSEKLRMTKLQKIGGAHDGGVDVRGNWPVDYIYVKTSSLIPSLETTDTIKRTNSQNGFVLKPLKYRMVDHTFKPLKVLVQCKAFTKSKLSPKEFRELVGTFTSLVSSSQRNKTVCIMCSPHLLTKDTLKLINNISLPMIYLRVEMLKEKPDGEFDLRNSGRLVNYYENSYASALLKDCRISEWLKLGIYKNNDFDLNEKGKEIPLK